MTTVNWFGAHYSVPWYFVWVPVILLIALILLLSLRILTKRTYVCPTCGKRHKPKRYDFRVLLHVGKDRLQRCPFCGETNFSAQTREDPDE